MAQAQTVGSYLYPIRIPKLGEHTRPRVWLDAPSQPASGRAHPRGKFHTILWPTGFPRGRGILHPRAGALPILLRRSDSTRRQNPKLENHGWTPINPDENRRPTTRTLFPHRETSLPVRNRARNCPMPQPSVLIPVPPWLNYHVRSRQQQPARRGRYRNAVEKQSEKSP